MRHEGIQMLFLVPWVAGREMAWAGRGRRWRSPEPGGGGGGIGSNTRVTTKQLRLGKSIIKLKLLELRKLIFQICYEQDNLALEVIKV